MYKVNHPKIHLTILESYDVKTKEFTRKCEDIVFNDVQELISFLVPNTYPRLNYMGNPVCNQFKNVYWDYQTLNGTTYYYEDYTALRGYGIPNGYIKTDWNHMIGKYMFWLDSPGCPYYDVRNLKKEVINRYISEYPEYNNPHMMLWLKKFTVRQNRSRHSLKYDRTNSKYIKRVKEFDGLKHDEPEYRLLAKPKDKELFIYSYDEDNFTHNHSGTGWKDNSGKKFRHQWERKEYRIFKKDGRIEIENIPQGIKEAESEIDMRNNELYNRMKSIVEKVSQKYLGGESYFTELDEMIRNDEELIIKVINHISNSYGYNIVSTGNFGMKIAELLENNRFDRNFKLLVFNGGLRKGAETKLVYSNGEASNPLNSWCFVDDSFYSGKTLNAVMRKLSEKFKIDCTHHFAFYDGSTNHMCESLYRYWR